jgi:hypothetical protein
MSVSRVAIEVPVEVDATVTGCLVACPGIAAGTRVIAMLEWALKSSPTRSATTMCKDGTLALD